MNVQRNPSHSRGPWLVPMRVFPGIKGHSPMRSANRERTSTSASSNKQKYTRGVLFGPDIKQLNR